MIGGFGTAGLPDELIDALLDQGARELTWSTTTPATATPASRRC
jgi:acyl CoA:acetate/3-ketoacid CoA transferase alpha subunit